MFVPARQGEMMTTRCRTARSAPAAARLGAVALALALAGCTTAAIEDVAPAAAADPWPERAFATPGDYPNLNVVPTPAAAQFTEEEKAERMGELRSRRDSLNSQAAGRGVRDRTAELRRLGRSHADETLKAIEDQ